jgi:hypothetical protein
MRLVALALAAMLGGCGVTLTYGKPPAVPRSATAEAQCFHRKSVKAGSAEGYVEWSTGDAHYRGLIEGIAFYRDGELQRPMQVLAMLGDDELRETYEARLESLEDARLNYALLTLLGVAITAAGGALTTWTIREQAEGLPITASVVITGSGLAVWIYSHARWRKWKGTHQAYDRVFMDPTLFDRLHYVIDRNDRTIARECGYEVVSLPTP